MKTKNPNSLLAGGNGAGTNVKCLEEIWPDNQIPFSSCQMLFFFYYLFRGYFGTRPRSGHAHVAAPPPPFSLLEIRWRRILGEVALVYLSPTWKGQSWGFPLNPPPSDPPNRQSLVICTFRSFG